MKATPTGQDRPSLLLHFPCTGQAYESFTEEPDSVPPPVTIELLLRQREFESDPANGKSRWITCARCENAQARYLVCRRKSLDTDLLFFRRFPLTKTLHRPECPSFQRETIETDPEPPGSEGQKPPRPTRGDFTPLCIQQLDPELRPVPTVRTKRVRSHSAHPPDQRKRGSQPTISLRRFASELLQSSGVCDWRPSFQSNRSERTFNGLVLGALKSLGRSEAVGKAATLLQGLPPGTQIVPWSFLDPQYPHRMPAPVVKFVGFGFIESIGMLNDRGARSMVLTNFPGQPILVPSGLLAIEADNTRSPFYPGADTHNVWVMLIAEQYDGIWKVHHLVWFRVSKIGLIPIESRKEEMMVERLIGERRSFRRWLLPPPNLGGLRYIPDFQLLDTDLREFIEVAGLMNSAVYAANIARKIAILGPRLLVWDTEETPLREFVLPRVAA